MSAQDTTFLAIVVLTMVLAVGAAAMGGGMQVVRRQARQFVVLGASLVAVVLAVRFVSTQFDDGAVGVLGLVLLVAGVSIMFLQLRRLRRDPERPRFSEQAGRPAFWLLFGGFLVAVLAIPLAMILAGTVR